MPFSGALQSRVETNINLTSNQCERHQESGKNPTIFFFFSFSFFLQGPFGYKLHAT